MARIENDKGFHKDVRVSQDVQNEFEKDGITSDYGFSIVNRGSGEVTLIAFVPVDKDHKVQGADKTREGAARVVNRYNDMFEEVAVKGK